ncbi:hypothetical protein, partial [Bacteroides sp. An269]|uniref:hypothetical protein n=1 Tax=Bacteroides sp. An269 TaxID=1965613 RepID=UPI000B58657C
CILFNSLITKLMKTFNKIKKFSGYLDYNIEETVLNLSCVDLGWFLRYFRLCDGKDRSVK